MWYLNAAMQLAPPARRRKVALAILAAILAAAALLAWIFVDGVRFPAVFTSVQAMEAAIASWGVWAPLASAALMVVHSFVPFPAEMLAVANGMLFGLGPGVAITWCGGMLGALLAFALARWLGQAFVQRLVGEKRRRQIEAFADGYGVRALLLARLTPVISFNLVNYAAGLAGVGWWTFAWTTAVGILPITVASVLVGSHMAVIPWGLWAVLALAIAGLMFLHWRYRRTAAAQPDSTG